MPDDILIRFSVRDDGTPVIERVNEKFKKTKKEAEGLFPAFERGAKGIGNFVSQNAALIGVLTGVGLALKSSYDAFQQYAQQVRDVAAISGTGAEEASKLLQVLDDYQISAEDVAAATRAMTKEGLVPSIETLAQLSDQYNAIQDPMQKNEFIIKNLGRAGLQWVNVLKQGGNALREMGDEVSKNLILSDEQIEAAEKQRLAMDALSDAWEGFKVQVGAAIGNIIVSGQEIKKLDRELEKLLGMDYDKIARASAANAEFADSVFAMRKQIERGQAATEYWNKWLKSQGSTIAEETLPSVKELSQQYQEWLDLIGDISDEQKDHSKTMEDLQASYEEESRKLNELTQTRWWDVQAIEEQKSKLADLQSRMDEEAAAFEENSRRRVLAMLEERLAADGLSEAETRYLEDLGLKWGIYSQSAVDAARAARAEVDELARRFESLPTEKSVTIRFTSINAEAIEAAGRTVVLGGGRASGGSVAGGRMYEVTEAGMPELLAMNGRQYLMMPPNASGTVQPMQSAQSGGAAGGENVIAMLKQFADEIARANRAAFEKVGRR